MGVPAPERAPSRRPRRRWVNLTLLVALLTSPTSSAASIDLQLVANGLSLLVDIQHAGDASGRLFLVLQGGTIVIYDGAQVLPTPFLDISGLVQSSGERGLLGLAFHPAYASNGRFYINYTNTSNNMVVACYTVSADSNVADAGSAAVVLTTPQPYTNHNGGQIQFGPDGFLYIALGDGGSGGDPQNQGQNRGTLLGSLLRLDVDSASPYAIPPGNPFVGDPNGLDEIWTWGLRNPWRFSFDRATGDLLVADVGQGAWEEVTFQAAGDPGGRNYGWRLMEGAHCFNPTTGCDDGTLTTPVLEYAHTLGCSITGGFRYRGTLLTAYVGSYFFGDLCTGRLWAATPETATRWTATEVMNTSLTITTFGEDENGEIFVSDYGGSGTLRQLVSAMAPTPRLSVALLGAGKGGITSSPAVIECGHVCGAHYAAGTSVTLTAVSDPGFTFEGYGGDADCADGVVTLSSDTSCTALFGAGFTDDPIVSGVTPVRAVHITELRIRINALRVACGLGTFAFTDASLVGVVVKAIHLTEMRTALGAAYTACGMTEPAYSDPLVTAGATAVRAVHIAELRDAVVALE